jgi:CSLREA domain-containing protein
MPRITAVLLLASLPWLLPASPVAAQPANDDWLNRTAIAALPFTPPAFSADAATSGVGDPLLFCRLGSDPDGAKTVWYAYATGAASEYVDVAALGYDAVVGVYTGSPQAGFTQVAGGCNDDGGAARGARIHGLRLAPATAYSIVVAAASPSVVANSLSFSLRASRIHQVTTTEDLVSGGCAATCSLRDAIAAANLDPGAVLVPPGTYALVLDGVGENGNFSGDLDVRAGIGIHAVGAGEVVIDAAGSDRALHIDPTDLGAFTVALSGLVLRNGNAGFGDGGALYNEASSATPVPRHDYVDLTRMVIENSRSNLNGGGARLNGIAAISESRISGNTAGSSGGGLSFAGPVAQPLRWRVARSTVSENASTGVGAGGGGGIHTTTLSAVLGASTVSGNTAAHNGGGVLVTQQGSLAIADSTIAFNGAGGSGGGLRHEAVTVSVANSVLAGNEIGSGPVTFTQDCATPQPVPTFIGSFVTSETICGFTTADNVVVGATLLGALTDNGGPTKTHRPLPGSPLIDSGPPTCIATDQRGTTRPQDGDANGVSACDRGSYEVSTADVDPLFGDGFEPAPPPQ